MTADIQYSPNSASLSTPPCPLHPCLNNYSNQGRLHLCLAQSGNEPIGKDRALPRCAIPQRGEGALGSRPLNNPPHQPYPTPPPPYMSGAVAEHRQVTACSPFLSSSISVWILIEKREQAGGWGRGRAARICMQRSAFTIKVTTLRRLR